MNAPRCLPLILLLTACSAGPANVVDGASPNANASVAVDGGDLGDAGTAATSPATCPEGAAFSQKSGKVVVDVSVNGGPKVKAVIDTGASQTILASSLGAGANGVDVSLAGRSVHVDRVAAGDAMLATLRLPEIRAVIGADVLGKYALTLDYPRGRWMLDDAVDDVAIAACAHVEAPHDWLPFKNVAGALYVRGTMESEEGWLLLDTGASLGVVTASTFEALATKQPHATLSGFYTPAAVGTFWAKLTSIAGMEVGGVRVEHVLSRTIDDELLSGAPSGAPLLGVVPSDFFGRTLVTFEYPRRRVRFAVGKGEPPRLRSKFFPVGISLEERLDAPPHVAAVLPGSAAADNDVAAGDALIALGGHPVDTLDPYARAWSLGAATAGAKITVTLRRGDVERTVVLETRDLL